MNIFINVAFSISWIFYIYIYIFKWRAYRPTGGPAHRAGPGLNWGPWPGPSRNGLGPGSGRALAHWAEPWAAGFLETLTVRDETWILHWLSVVLLNFSNINEIIPLKIKKPLEDSHFGLKIGSFINNREKCKSENNLLKKKKVPKKGL